MHAFVTRSRSRGYIQTLSGFLGIYADWIFIVSRRSESLAMMKLELMKTFVETIDGDWQSPVNETMEDCR